MKDTTLMIGQSLRWWSVALVLAAGLLACDEDAATTTWRRCAPELLTVSPGSGPREGGGTSLLTGRHLVPYLADPLDVSMDLAVFFGPNPARVDAVFGPQDVDPGDADGIVDDCGACLGCVEGASDGCAGCEQECRYCQATVRVVVPAYDGGDPAAQAELPVSVTQGMGVSNPLPYRYEAAPPTPSPSPSPGPSPTVTP